jgi:hypothetical protein
MMRLPRKPFHFCAAVCQGDATISEPGIESFWVKSPQLSIGSRRSGDRKIERNQGTFGPI